MATTGTVLFNSYVYHLPTLLVEENGGTQVTVRKTGFEALPDDIRQQEFDPTTTGYEKVLVGLKTYLEGEI